MKTILDSVGPVRLGIADVLVITSMFAFWVWYSCQLVATLYPDFPIQEAYTIHFAKNWLSEVFSISWKVAMLWCFLLLARSKCSSVAGEWFFVSQVFLIGVNTFVSFVSNFENTYVSGSWHEIEWKIQAFGVSVIYATGSVLSLYKQRYFWAAWLVFVAVSTGLELIGDSWFSRVFRIAAPITAVCGLYFDATRLRISPALHVCGTFLFVIACLIGLFGD